MTAIDLNKLQEIANSASEICTDLYGDRYFKGSWSCAELDKQQDDFLCAFKPCVASELIEIAKSKGKVPSKEDLRSYYVSILQDWKELQRLFNSSESLGLANFRAELDALVDRRIEADLRQSDSPTEAKP